MEQLAQRLRAGLEEVGVAFDGTEVLPVTVSVGICAYPDHAAATTELLSAAAVALTEAKASGGDSIRVAQAGEEQRVVAGSFDVLQGLVLAAYSRLDHAAALFVRLPDDVGAARGWLAGIVEEVGTAAQLAAAEQGAPRVQVALTAQSYTGTDCTGSSGTASAGAGFNFLEPISTNGEWHTLPNLTALLDATIHSVRFTASFQVNTAAASSIVLFDDLEFAGGSVTTTSTLPLLVRQ